MASTSFVEFGGFYIDLRRDRQSQYYKDHVKACQLNNTQPTMRCWYD